MYKKLSVLIPVYNEKNTIKTCVESVLNADIKNMELAKSWKNNGFS